MGKGKKSSGKTYTSKGERRSSIKTAVRDPGQRLLNQIDAWSKGKNVVYTIENPNKNETNRKFIRVNARDMKGDARKQKGYMI